LKVFGTPARPAPKLPPPQPKLTTQALLAPLEMLSAEGSAAHKQESR